MNKVIGAAVVAALCFAAPQSAHAMHDCGPMQIRIGMSGRNPVAHTTVGVTYDGRWTVIHHMVDGTDYDRDAQYHMTNIARSDGGFEWYGYGTVNPNNEMHGMLFRQNGRLWYQETIFDTAHNRKIVDDTTQDCGEATTTVASAPIPSDPPASTYTPAPAPAPVPATGPDSVPFVCDNGAMFVSAAIAGRPVTMQVDTGANTCTIGETLANELTAAGEATVIGQTTGSTATGGSYTTREISVSMLVVGQHWGKNIHMTVMPTDKPPLLSLPILLSSGNGRFTVDAHNRQIIFG
jgi:hypothetical protein